MRPFITNLAVSLLFVLSSTEVNGQVKNRKELLNAAKSYPFRVWADDTGRHQTIAKYLRHDQQSVTILKENKLVLVIPVSRLSERDLKYVERLGNKSIKIGGTSTASAQKQLVKKPDTKEEINESDNVFAELQEFVAAAKLSRIDLRPEQQDRITEEGLRRPLAKLDWKTLRKTLNQLTLGWPNEPQQSLLEAVAKCTETGNYSIDETALMLLMNNDPTPHFELFNRVVEREQFNLRLIAYQSLAAINDERSLKVLMRRFDSDDNVFIGKLLPEFGNRAEPLLMEHLNHIEPDHVLVTISILAEIGTQLSIPSLVTLSKESDRTAIRQQASTAIKTIKARLAKAESE